MEAAMMEGNNAYMKYMQTHKHTKVSDGTVSIDQLPLIKVEPKSKKSFKEFFQVIRNVSDVDVAAIRSVMSEASPKYAHLPAVFSVCICKVCSCSGFCMCLLA